jgi:hypothetical protein
MQKKLDIHELDIPADDIDCWNRYPKHRWVYELSRLLDSQNIRWSPFQNEIFLDREINISLKTDKNINIHPGFIFLRKPQGNSLITEAYIIKGEIKLLRHIDPSSDKELSQLIGQIELRISAFITLYFQKFTGVISFETLSNDIFGIKLRPYLDITIDKNPEVIKFIKRIYKKIDLNINGLTDRVIHETFAT